MTARECACSDPRTQMRLVDPDPVPAFDASSFATYDNEQDAAPLESELVEELPERPGAVGNDEPVAESRPVERPPFRGKGYLRAEAPPTLEETDSATSPDVAAASDIDDDAIVVSDPDSMPAAAGDASVNPVTNSASSVVQGESAANAEVEPSRSRRRRRPRRRRRRSGENSENKGDVGTQTGSAQPAGSKTDQNTLTAGTVSTESSDRSGQAPAAADSASSGTTEDKPKSDKPAGRRRRRRSRNRGRGKDEGGS